MKTNALPFDGLLGKAPSCIPPTRSATVVLQGTRIPKGREPNGKEQAAILDDATDRATQLQRVSDLQKKAAARARSKRYRETPRAKAVEKARVEATRERRRETRKAWEELNRDRLMAYKREWQRRSRMLHPELAEADRARARKNSAKKKAHRPQEEGGLQQPREAVAVG